MNSLQGPTIIFREEQRFTSAGEWWVWLLVFLSLAVAVSLCIYPIGVALGWVPRGEGLRSGDTGAFVGPLIGLAVCIVAVLLLLVSTLTTEVRDTGLYLRYFPFHLSFKRISTDHLRDLKAVTYRPVRDYGGWGIRGSRKRRAYNVGGNRGVMLLYDNGRQLLIGSQWPERLEEAIRTILTTTS